MTKFDGASLDIKQTQIEKLKQAFSEIVTEGKIDWEKLKLTLGEEVVLSGERYVLNWAGKTDAYRAVQTQTTATLKPQRDQSINFDTTQNIFIEGENLEVLKVLQRAYYGKVKMITIDPPYNTGNDSFIYPDKFSETKEQYLKRIGDKDEAGYLTKEGLFRKNSRESGQFHSNWLSMMYPRLFLARNLLREDGVIFVCIDDHEAHNLRLILNEIFGEENFVASIIWQKKYAASNDAKGIAVMHDYILVYQKSNQFERNLFPRTEKQDSLYKYDDLDGRGRWRSDNLLVKSFQEDYVFPIKNPNTGKEYYPPKGSCWRAGKDTIEKWITENRIFFGKDGKGAPQLKRYLNEVQQGVVPTTWWNFQDAGHNDEANKELKKIFGIKAPFDTPKPSKLIKRMLQITTKPSNNDIILDFFAGSSTTAHAVLDLNKSDDGNRNFIMVQLNERTDKNSEAYKAGFKSIAEIGKERIKLVMNNIKKKNDSELFNSKNQDIGFKSFILQPSNFKIWRTDTIDNEEDLKRQMEAFVDPVRPDAEVENMAWEILLKSGYELSTPLERTEIAGTPVYSIADNEQILLLESLSQKAIDEIIKRKPSRVVCLDRLFNGNDQLKTNTALQMKDAGVEFRTV